MPALNEREIALAGLVGAQQQAAASAQRVAVAAAIQLKLLSLYWVHQDEAVLHDPTIAEPIAAAAVHHTDALFTALAGGKAASRY